MTEAVPTSPTALGGRRGKALGDWVAGAPEKALEAARRALRSDPADPLAALVEVEATRRLGDAQAALSLAESWIAKRPGHAGLQLEAARCLAELGRRHEAITRLEALTRTHGAFAPAWQELAALRRAVGDEAGARAAARRHSEAVIGSPELAEAAELIQAGKLGQAEHRLRAFVKSHPKDVSAIRLLADVALRLGVLDDARKLLERCLELAPDFHLARLDYANCLIKQQDYDAAEEILQTVLQGAEHDASAKILLALLRVRTGRHEEACGLYAEILKVNPAQARIQLSHGHALKTIGRQADAIEAYRAAVEAEPALGEAYWSLANLKTVQFDEVDIAAMEAALKDGELTPHDRFHMLFALGKALEDRGRFEPSLEAYRRGNALRRKTIIYDPERTKAEVDRLTSFFNADFFEARAGWGDPSPDPIFIVGLPRSGSTLQEQILASHPDVDGTFELPDIISIARRLSGKKRRDDPSAYPECLAALSQEEVRALGAEYLERTRQHRGSAPRFIDKMPNNFMHVGLIKLILPNATIIDARRHPMACCFSNFKQLFARGQNFTYELNELGHYYLDYLRLMRAWEDARPGTVLRVIYEDVVADFEVQVRRVLEFTGLDFHPDCVNFHSTDRAVRTASSEQVRQPIYTTGLDQWQNFEPGLDALKQVLAPELGAGRTWDR